MEIEEMPERHLQEYHRYYAEQPFGQWRDDYRMAVLASTITAGQLKKPLGPDKFMQFWGGESFSGDSVEEVWGDAKEL